MSSDPFSEERLLVSHHSCSPHDPATASQSCGLSPVSLLLYLSTAFDSGLLCTLEICHICIEVCGADAELGKFGNADFEKPAGSDWRFRSQGPSPSCLLTTGMGSKGLTISSCVDGGGVQRVPGAGPGKGGCPQWFLSPTWP